MSPSEPPPADAAPDSVAPSSRGEPRPQPELVEEIRARVAELEGSDAVGAARAWVELGILSERGYRDRVGARRAYERARALAKGNEPALVRLRRLFEGRGERAQAALAILDEQLAVTTGPRPRADLLAERGRLLVQAGRTGEARAAYAEALRVAPEHPASLRGWEVVLRLELARAPEKPGAREALAGELVSLLERVSRAATPTTERLDGDVRLAAWLEVERAELAERLLEKRDVARAALNRAVTLAPGPGPVRDALTRHLLRAGDAEASADSLALEGDAEQDGDRAARLLYAAARLRAERLDAPAMAAALLGRAAARVATVGVTATLVMEELVRVLEDTGEREQAVDARRRLLRLRPRAGAQAHEHMKLAEAYSSLGLADQAVREATRSLELDPAFEAARELLDRTLQRLGRHEDRLALWVAQANRAGRAEARVRAFERASDIALRHLKRREDALRLLQAAVELAPADPAVLASLAALLAPAAAADGAAARRRLELWTLAAAAEVDPGRKVAFLDKASAILEEELGDPRAVMDLAERTLELAPRHLPAVLALGRCAERADDPRRLVRALVLEAGLTSTREVRRSLLLRAAAIERDRLGDKERAAALVERAIELDPKDDRALAARQALEESQGRDEDARATLLARIAAAETPAAAFELWLDVARLDEVRLKRPRAAADALAEAARLAPESPLPAAEVARLLHATGDHEGLERALVKLAEGAAPGLESGALWLRAAEIASLRLGDDARAAERVGRALAIPEVCADPIAFEALERLLVRHASPSVGPGLVLPIPRAGLGDPSRLADLYSRWLAASPRPAVDHAVRLSLARLLAGEGDPLAIELLVGLVGVVPDHVPALRGLEQLHRAAGAQAKLAGALGSQAASLTSRIGRASALWELAMLEEAVGPPIVLGALHRIVDEDPLDTGALDASLRILSRLDLAQTAELDVGAEVLRALVLRKEAALDPVARAFWELEEGLVLEGRAADAPTLERALGVYRAALTRMPESLVAARGLERLAAKLGDRRALRESQLALGVIARDGAARAVHLVRAAELEAELRLGDGEDAYVRALAADPDSEDAARALLRLLEPRPARLADVLGHALARATLARQVLILAAGIGRAALASEGQPGAPDPRVGVEAVRRGLAVAPNDVGLLALVAGLYSASRLHAEAEGALRRVVELRQDAASVLAARYRLAELYAGPLSRPDGERAEHEAILELDPRQKRALERLRELGERAGDLALVKRALRGLVDAAVDARERVETALVLAEACRKGGDDAGARDAWAEAVVASVSAPGGEGRTADARAWQALARAHRLDTPQGAAAYVRAIERVIEVAQARRVPPDALWLATIGFHEATSLGRPTEGVAHLNQACALPSASPDTFALLGRALEAVNRNGECIQVLRDVVTAPHDAFVRVSDLPAALTSLESAYAKDGRPAERLGVEEVRAALGEVAPERLARLAARRLPQEAPHPGSLGPLELGRLIAPAARTRYLDVAFALAPVVSKALRFDLASLGVSSRDRVGARDGGSLRVQADRLARALSVDAFELYVSPAWSQPARAVAGDTPIVVVPAGLADAPEPEQLFVLGRCLFRIASGTSFVEDLPLDSLDGLLLAGARIGHAGFGVGELSPARERALGAMLPALQRAVGRRQRKMLEDTAPHLHGVFDPRLFLDGLRQTELRVGYLLAGDVLAALEALRRELRFDGNPRSFARIPQASEVLRYALSGEALAERTRMGTFLGSP